MRSRILSIVGLFLFAAAALFWSDAYSYMVSARAEGQPFVLSEYAHSVKNRMQGRPDAMSLRRDRRQAEAAAATPKMAISVGALNGQVEKPLFQKVGQKAEPDEQGGSMESRFGGSGGIQFIGDGPKGGCTMVGGMKRCRVGG